MANTEDVPPPLEIDPYVVLGIESSATTADIKSAYKKLALRNHPGMSMFPKPSPPILLTRLKTKSLITSGTTPIQSSKKSPLPMPSFPMIAVVNAMTQLATPPNLLILKMTTLTGLTSSGHNGPIRLLPIGSTISLGGTGEVMRRSRMC